MSEKIAVHCETEELWNSVFAKMLLEKSASGNKYNWKEYRKESCLSLNHCDVIAYSPISYWQNADFTIISAADYLQDNTTFKVGDRVECVDVGGFSTAAMLEVGKTYTIKDLCTFGDNFYIKESGYNYPPKHFKKLTNQTKTTKEDTMNINDNVLEVFENSKDAKKVANRFGTQYGTTDRDTLALKRDKKDLLAIIKAEEDAAAKEK